MCEILHWILISYKLFERLFKLYNFLNLYKCVYFSILCIVLLSCLFVENFWYAVCKNSECTIDEAYSLRK